eukprot:GHVP01069498.1.p1 GENE.GHVP01069498.1~~GHVP01069498.1.p1  ORF type:complete len:112 (-),score=23.20 GHVP01069498.1:342-677(-)
MKYKTEAKRGKNAYYRTSSAYEYEDGDVTYYPKGNSDAGDGVDKPGALATITREDSKVSIFFVAPDEENVIVTATYKSDRSKQKEVQKVEYFNAEILEKIFNELMDNELKK